MRTERLGVTREGRMEARKENAIATAHAEVVKTCLTFLSRLDRHEMGVNIPKPLDEDAKDLKFSNFEMYACFYWADHYLRAYELRPWSLLMDFLLSSSHIITMDKQAVGVLASFASPSYVKWVSLMWRVFHSTQYPLGTALQLRLEDTISDPPDPLFVLCIWGFNGHARTLFRQVPTLEDAKNIRGKSPLLLACEYGNHNVVEMILDKEGPTRIRMRIHCGDWGTSLQAAAWGGDMETFALLLRQSSGTRYTPDVNHEPGFYGRLLDACIHGANGQIVALAVRQGVEIWLPVDPPSYPALGVRPAIAQSLLTARHSPYYRGQEAIEGPSYHPISSALTPKDVTNLCPRVNKSLLHRLLAADSRRRQVLAYMIKGLAQSEHLVPFGADPLFRAQDLCIPEDAGFSDGK